MSSSTVANPYDHVGKAPNGMLLPSRSLIWLLRGLCLTALGVSGYLAWTSFTATKVYGCGGDVFDCGHVLTSGWSHWFGIPVSVPAVALYASLLAVLLFFRREAPRRLITAGWQLLTVGGISAGLAALWFIGLQVFVIRHLCIYCLGAHACGLLLAGIVLYRRPLGTRMTALLGSAGIAAAAVLVVGQILTPPPQTFTVEHFDDATASEQLATADRDDVQLELFAPPTDVFSAPEDVFSTPADVFAAPEESASDRTTGDAVAVEAVGAVTAPARESDELPLLRTDVPDVPATATENLDSSGAAGQENGTRITPKVTASLLMFFPAGLNSVTRIVSGPGFLTDEKSSTPADTPATAADPTAAKADDAAKTDSATTAEDKEKPAADKPAADKPEPEKAAEPATPEPRIISGSGNRFRLNIAQWPLLGKQDAKYVFIEMFDYTCPHCRNTHGAIQEAFRKYGDDLAIVALAVPLHPSCNSAASGSSLSAESCELARISIAVWRVKPDRFKEFHDWMFDAGRSRTVSEAKRHAEQLVGQAELQKELGRKTASEYISRHVELYKKVGSGAVPKLIFPRTTMTGEVGSGRTLSQMIERELSVGQ